MSTSNIVDRNWHNGSYYVTFACKEGDVREYRYNATAGAAIAAGADPARFRGEQVYVGQGRSLKFDKMLGEAATEIYAEVEAAAAEAAEALAAGAVIL